ncbi:Per1-like protein [Crucibulum laeve]|uniref:Post-GPI attachment to proteins factor 3 n=1 Tax=Crucibulum laeve TaxID=68775 RepID=A0A5C3LIF4_9AGAR|nr:Per1-like protein [Crucibulum laeve]
MRRAAKFLFIAAAAGSALASWGDRAPEFVNCVTRCATDRCSLGSTALPLSLRVTGWSCNDDCKYTCMHQITDEAIVKGTRIHQYYGKWPFWRFLGMQEPASVAFSLMNLWAHVQGARKVRKQIPDFHPMKSYYLIWSFASMNAWIWSSVFHTRDLPTTEKLDYFSAALAILYALYYTTVRLFHLYPPPQQSRLTLSTRTPKSFKLKALSWLCTAVYLAHISYLTLLPRFDYTYNMAFNLGLGLVHNALWLLYSLPVSVSILQRFPSQPKSYRPTFVTQAAIFVALTTAATALELFDFPPWGRIIDAHALWHLVTVPIAVEWYKFLIQDALDPTWREQRK